MHSRTRFLTRSLGSRCSWQSRHLQAILIIRKHTIKQLRTRLQSSRARGNNKAAQGHQDSKDSVKINKKRRNTSVGFKLILHDLYRLPILLNAMQAQTRQCIGLRLVSGRAVLAIANGAWHATLSR